MFFSNIDYTSNKNIVKGLIELSLSQELKIHNLSSNITTIENHYKKQLVEKTKQLNQVTTELNSMKNSLKASKLFPYLNILVITEKTPPRKLNTSRNVARPSSNNFNSYRNDSSCKQNNKQKKIFG